MASTIEIGSPAELSSILSASRVVVTLFYKNEGANVAAAMVYEDLAKRLTRTGVVTFTQVDITAQPQIAQSYNVANPPTFIIFKSGRQLSKVNGSNPAQLSDAIKRLAAEAEAEPSSSAAAGGSGSSSSANGVWLGASLPRGYTDLTEQVDVRGLDLLNADSEFGSVRTLFENEVPSSLGKGKAAGEAKKDWVESDVDEQLMLYVPLTTTAKVHTVLLTSLPPKNEDDDDETPMRPKTIHIYTNKQHNLGFEEAEDVPATQTVELKAGDWAEATGTARIELRFVKFQNVSSLVFFVVDGDGEGERTRIDRLRIIGEAGEKREMGKLEKIGDGD